MTVALTVGEPPVVSSSLEQYPISDFLEWEQNKQLKLNPDFQRGRVWTAAAKSYLVDTILRSLPIPKIYLRTRVDLVTKRSYREVVDGQQRLRAVIEFSRDEFGLDKRAGEFAGLRYSKLPDELQTRFLSYPISVDQLMNAGDEDVLEVFARLNSYNVVLNPPEKRHAIYQGDFKWVVHASARDWSELWDDLRVVSTRQRVRMLHDSLMAEMFGVVLRGVTDGGQPKIDRLYEEVDRSFPEDGEPYKSRVDSAVAVILKHFKEMVQSTPLTSAPHFLMLFAAVAHALDPLPPGDLDDDYPPPSQEALSDLELAAHNIARIGDVLEADEAPRGWNRFWSASKSSTQRIGSRRVRFPVYYGALLPRPLEADM